MELFSHETDDSINPRYESLIKVDLKYQESQFCFLGCKIMTEKKMIIIF